MTRIDAQINEALLGLEKIDKDAEAEAFAIHHKIGRLRFERNKHRSELLDLQSRQKVLKRQFYEKRFMETLAQRDPLLFFEIERSFSYTEGSDSIEVSMLAHQRANCYRKLESSFGDQESMLIQRQRSSLFGKEDLEWEARLEHALSRSRQFFVRQCAKIKSIRERISVLTGNDYAHQFYKAAVIIMGRDAVNQYQLERPSLKRAA